MSYQFFDQHKEHDSSNAESLAGSGDEHPTASCAVSSSRKQHIDSPGVLTHELQHHRENSLAGSKFYWQSSYDGPWVLNMESGGNVIDTNIWIYAERTGVYSLYVGGEELLSVPTKFQAIRIGDALAFTFKHSLPVPDKYGQSQPRRTTQR